MRWLLETLLHWVLAGVAVYLSAKLVPGFAVRSFGAAVLLALVLAVLNTVAWVVLAPLSIAFSILTLGLGILLINTVVFLLASRIVSGVEVTGFLPALLASIVVSLMKAATRLLVGGR